MFITLKTNWSTPTINAVRDRTLLAFLAHHEIVQAFITVHALTTLIHSVSITYIALRAICWILADKTILWTSFTLLGLHIVSQSRIGLAAVVTEEFHIALAEIDIQRIVTEHIDVRDNWALKYGGGVSIQSILNDVGFLSWRNGHYLLIFTQTAKQVVSFELYIVEILQFFKVVYFCAEVLGQSEPGILLESLRA